MKKKTKEIKYYEGIGRRKESVARVRLYICPKNEIKILNKTFTKGEIFINSVPASQYFSFQTEQNILMKPFIITENKDRFVTLIKVKGGGKNGQLEAAVLGISRCLVKVDKNYKKKLREENLLTRDAREKERRKVGTGGKARRKKQSPKR